MDNLRTFEGTLIIRWWKNDSFGGDRRPITIDVKDTNELKREVARIKRDFMELGENNELPYSVTLDLNERALLNKDTFCIFA